ncbi:MAG: DUF4954 family protein, partial [Muribaculaceae bacterium]|nr:DUF4954 family protein [Muribaculaceae bacterium]
LRNIKVCNGARIEDCGLIEFNDESSCGVGIEVDVLDETGSREVRIYPGLTAQTALLMAREPKWRDRHFANLLDSYLENISIPHEIGERSVIIGCGTLRDVSVAHEVHIEGAQFLCNGTIVNNAASGRSLAYIGQGVNAENFILEDGRLDSGAIVRNCYIGQGACLEKGFSAHDSLFFANCSLENGEACALFAGPYTVSMHKSTLLIGCQTSFLNAGSGSNQSNHMYKMGPVHWGIMERGVKTSSDSYLMLGAKIGAFSLLMGQHKTHPDSSQFPFSYLFGDDRGATVVVPAVMLRSCGLLRDEKKWPARDRRTKRKLPLRDRIIFDVLNPTTVDKMLSAYEVIEKLLARPADDDRFVRYKGMKFTRASLERARHLYELAICKYLDNKLPTEGFSSRFTAPSEADEWVDLVGLLIRRNDLSDVMRAESLEEMENTLTSAFNRYSDLEQDWIQRRFPVYWRRPKEIIHHLAIEFDRMVEEDRARYLEDLAAQNSMLAL